MRILFVISSLSIGGEQRAASILLDHFVKRGHSVQLLTFKKRNNSISLNNMVQTIVYKPPKYINRNVSKVLKIRKLIKKERYDVVIGFAFLPSVLTSFASFGISTPVLIAERNDPSIYNKKWKILRWLAYKKAEGAVFQTKQASDYFNEKLFRKRAVIPNPLKLEDVPYSNKNKKNIIVNTSRFVVQKNHKLLIKAFALVLHKNIAEDYKLYLFGDGPEKNNVMEFVKDLQIDDKVFFFPETPDVLNKMKDCSIFFLPSNHEGYPNSLLEAMAMGIAPISTDCRIGGPRDIILNNQNGLLIEVNNTSQAVDALSKLIKNRQFREQLSNKAIEVRQRFDSEIIGDRWIEFIEQLL